MHELRCDVVAKIGLVSVRKHGWRLELNLVSWNGHPPRLDLREWSPDGEKMGKGITLTRQEAEELVDLLEMGLETQEDLAPPPVWEEADQNGKV